MKRTERRLLRLVDMDIQLSSPDGLRTLSFARRHNIDWRTVMRLIESIRAIGLEIESTRNKYKNGYVFRYVGRQRLFSMSTHRMMSE